MAKELGTRGQERYDWRLIDVSPRRSETADHKIQFVAKKSVVRIGDEVNGERAQRRDGGDQMDFPRCPWATSAILTAYHDREWGVPLHDDSSLFELLSLEGAQAGLSWETVLRKRERYRAVFSGFDPRAVARISPRRMERILQDPGIIRNRAKVQSTIANAKALLHVADEFGSFDAYVWQFVNGRPIVNRPGRAHKVPSSSKESAAMSKDLVRRGFRFVGPTICYAFMQAAGLVNDHLITCAWHKRPGASR